MNGTEPERHLEVGPRHLAGELVLQRARAPCLVLLFHRCEQGRSRRRNEQLALVLQRHGLSTLRVGLVLDGEPQAQALAEDAEAMAARMVEVIDWVGTQPGLATRCIALLGACVLGAAVLIAAGERRAAVSSVVSLGGHLDLLPQLPALHAPVLLVVGGLDTHSLSANRAAYQALGGRKRLELVPGAGHRFEEPGTLDTLAHTVADWLEHCKPGPP
ncbi:MAG: alpha/beta hydrolase [Rhizobacter sp.]|nr:alpha/beta hydrolase [Rhizobacter sp.]